MMIKEIQPPYCKTPVIGSPLDSLVSEVYNMDCVQGMKHYPDNYFDLAIVDPPYGIHDKLCRKDSPKNKSKFNTLYYQKQWDKERPQNEYWTELFRVSKNQIVFGANYFVSNLPVSRGWIFWDKMGENMSSVNNELIFTSFDISIKTFKRCHGLDKGFMNKEGSNIHPTQKPIALYNFILSNYAEKGFKILDTHLGSGSSRIASYFYGCDFVSFEIDEDYVKASDKRFKEAIAQQRLF